MTTATLDQPSAMTRAGWRVKTCPARIKAAGPKDGLEEGEFRALVSVFNNVDAIGDVVMPGAFKEDLAEWAAKGDPIPVLWSHDWIDPFSHVGVVKSASETADGLEVLATLDLYDEDDEGNRVRIPKAWQVYRLLKGRRVTQFSFAYDILDAGRGERDGEPVFELRKLHVFEVGPTLVGMNQSTDLLDVKSAASALDVATFIADVSAQLKAGRVLSAANESALRSALDKIAGGIEDVKSVLAKLATDDDTEKATGPDGSPAAKKAVTETKGTPPALVSALAFLAEHGD